MMLVLSRRESECIRLGDSIVVTVVRVAGDRVRLGIEAPSEVVVLRGNSIRTANRTLRRDLRRIERTSRAGKPNLLSRPGFSLLFRV